MNDRDQDLPVDDSLLDRIVDGGMTARRTANRRPGSRA